MARISAVTALRSHATFLRCVVGATYNSTTSESLVGCCVKRSLHRASCGLKKRDIVSSSSSYLLTFEKTGTKQTKLNKTKASQENVL